MKRNLKIDLKTILTLAFAGSIIVLTFMWLLPPKDAVLPLWMMVMWYYFNKEKSTNNYDNDKVL